MSDNTERKPDPNPDHDRHAAGSVRTRLNAQPFSRRKILGAAGALAGSAAVAGDGRCPASHRPEVRGRRCH
jgi:hypothetical protein